MKRFVTVVAISLLFASALHAQPQRGVVVPMTSGSQAAGRVPYGTGSGLTSSSKLTFYNDPAQVPGEPNPNDGYGLVVYPALLGEVIIATIEAPTGQAAPQTAGGGKTASYKVVAIAQWSDDVAPSDTITTTDSANNLTTASHGNVITWTAVNGAIGGYDIYRTAFNGATPATLGLIAHVSPGTGTMTYVDDGDAGDSADAPSLNETGRLTVISKGHWTVYLQGVTDTNYTDPNRSGSLLYMTDTTASATQTSFTNIRFSSQPGSDVYIGKYAHSTGVAADYQTFSVQDDDGTAVFSVDFSTGSGHTKGNVYATAEMFITGLKTTGSAGSKNVVCVDTSTGKLYASSSSTDCSN